MLSILYIVSKQIMMVLIYIMSNQIMILYIESEPIIFIS